MPSNTAHSAQLVSYLAATGIDEGLLLNFGAQSLEFKPNGEPIAPTPSLLTFIPNSVNLVNLEIP